MTEKTPPHPPIVRPGADPTHNDEQGGKRWHYLNLDGSKMDPCSFVYEHVSGGFGGECGHYIFPDGYSPAGPATMDHIRERIEAKLIELGSEVIDPPEWWAEAQTIRAALPDGFRLNGPKSCGLWYVSKGLKADPYSHPTPSAALRSALEEWSGNAKSTQKALDTLHRMLQEAGYSPDPAGLDEVLFQAGVRPGPAKPGAPGDIQAMTMIEPAPLGVTVTLPDGTRIDIGHKPAR